MVAEAVVAQVAHQGPRRDQRQARNANKARAPREQSALRRNAFRVARTRSEGPGRRTFAEQQSAQLGDAALLSVEDERRLARLARAGASAEALEARRQLVEANTRLVASVARYYYRLHTSASSNRITGHSVATTSAGGALDLDDLIQEGMIGLLRALDIYDPDQGRFTTYAVWWIRQAITRALVERGAPFHTPSYVYYRQRKLNALAEEFTQAEGRTPAPDDLAARSGLPEAQVRDLLDSMRLRQQPPLSLDRQIQLADGEGATLADLLADADAERELERALDRADTGAADGMLALMATFIRGPRATRWTQREMRVLLLRHVEGLSLSAIAARLGVTSERVRQLQRKGEERIKRERARVRRQLQGQRGA